MSATDEREQLGEALYEQVTKFHPKFAGKIVGMMLDKMEASEIKAVLDDESKLRQKVEQAILVLKGPGSEDSNSAEKDQIKLLQDELHEAEQWAEDMQREWDEKESRWKKEKEDLMSRVAVLEGRAKVAEKTPKNGADKLDNLTKQADEAEKRLRDAEQKNVKVQEELKATQERARELEAALDKAKKSAEDAEAAAKLAEKKAMEAVAAKKDAESEEQSVSDEVKEAERWCEDMVNKYKRELAAKDEELEKAKRALEEGP